MQAPPGETDHVEADRVETDPVESGHVEAGHIEPGPAEGDAGAQGDDTHLADHHAHAGDHHDAHEQARRAAQRRREILRRVRPLLLALVAILAVALAVPLAFTFPAKADAPGKSDAVLVLGPPTPARLALAERLMESGAAKTLVISEYSRLWAPRVPPCEGKETSYEVVCFISMPETTQGEAFKLRQLSRERGWTSVQVITFEPHVNRARTIVGRCFAGDVKVLQTDESWDGMDLVHHLAGWFKVATTTDC